MDDTGFTGGKSAPATLNQVGGLLRADSHYQEQGLAGYAGFDERASGAKAVGARRLDKPPPKSPPRATLGHMVDASTPAERYAIRRHLAGAQQCASQIVEAAGVHDAMAKASAGVALRQHLRELWRLRKAREDAWAEVVNFLQSALSGEPFEQFTAEQGEAVGRVIAEHLGMGAVDEDQPAKARRLLREVGLDPWKGISQREGGE